MLFDGLVDVFEEYCLELVVGVEFLYDGVDFFDWVNIDLIFVDFCGVNVGVMVVGLGIVDYGSVVV